MVNIKLTPNLKLKQQTQDENYNVNIQNDNMDILDSNIKKIQDEQSSFATAESLNRHTDNHDNPHVVTKKQIGLSNVVNIRQMNGLMTPVTDGNLPVFDKNGYTVKDSGYTIKTSVPEDAKFTDTVYVHPVSGVTQGTYTRVTTDFNGHITHGDNPTTLEEYGITDAVSGVKGENETDFRNGQVVITKENIGLENVENKSSSTIISEITKENIVTSLGYTPAVEGTNGTNGNSINNSWKTPNPETVLNRWCKIASITLSTTESEDYTIILQASELEMMYGSVIIHWNCNTDEGTSLDQMIKPCSLTALCGNGRTITEFFKQCFFTECIQKDETHITYNLWYEPKNDYLTYSFSILGQNSNRDSINCEIIRSPEYTTETLTGGIFYPENNSWPLLTNNCLATIPGISALDAVIGKQLKDDITALSEFQGLTSDIWHDMITPSGDVYARYTKKAGIVYVQANMSVMFSSTGLNDIGLTLSEGYRPPKFLYFYTISNGPTFHYVYIQEDGCIKVYGTSGKTSAIILNISFPV